MKRGDLPLPLCQIVSNEGAEVRRIRHAHLSKLLPQKAGGLFEQVCGPRAHHGDIEIEAKG